VLTAQHFPSLKTGSFLLNVGHAADEIDVAARRRRKEVLPFIEEVTLDGRTVFLFAGGSMANLTAGQGDSLNSLDITLGTMVAGLRFIFTPPPGITRSGYIRCRGRPGRVWRQRRVCRCVGKISYKPTHLHTIATARKLRLRRLIHAHFTLQPAGQVIFLRL